MNFAPVSRHLALICLLTAPGWLAAAPPSADLHSPLSEAVEQFLARHLPTLPGPTKHRITLPPTSTSRTACSELSVALAPGARAYGKTTLLARCLAPTAWQVHVPVQIDVQVRHLAAAQPLSQGQVLTEADIMEKPALLHDLPAGTLLDHEQAVGRATVTPIAAGQALRSNLLRAPFAVLAGQTVKVRLTGEAFEVSNEGRALQSVSSGQTVQIRLNNGQLLNGIAREGGWVEIKR